MKDEIMELGEVLETLNQEIARREALLNGFERVPEPVYLNGPVFQSEDKQDSRGDRDEPDKKAGETQNTVSLMHGAPTEGHQIGCRCPECKKLRRREYYARNRDKILEKRRQKRANTESTQPATTGDPEVDGLIMMFRGFMTEATRCTGDPARLRALREAAIQAISRDIKEVLQT